MKDIFTKAITKDVNMCLEFIHQVESAHPYQMESTELSLNECPAETYIEDGDFYLAFRTNKLLSQDERQALLRSDTKFTCRNANANLVFDFKSFASISSPLMKDPHRFECKVTKYHNEEIQQSKKRFFRELIPTEREQSPGSIFQSKPLRINNIVHSAGLVDVQITDQSFQLYPFNPKNQTKYYLIVESLQETTLSDFLKKVDIILLSYAFVTGYFPRDSRYLFSADDSSFTQICGIWYEILPHSLKSGYSVFPSSPLRIHFGLPHQIEFPKSFFDNLCNKLLGNEEFSRVLFLIVEGHTLSTELQATVYTVALEAITDVITRENESKFTPITDRSLAKEIIDSLLTLLNSYAAKLSPEALDTLQRKISVINSPTNKQKLLKPFQLLNLTLAQKEIDCINSRNDFLHGRLPLTIGDSEQKFQLQQIALTLLYCVTILILKYVDYSGFVMYYPTLNEFKNKKAISDYLIKHI